MYYRKNIEGDVIGIFDEEGETLVTYVYDAWGNILLSSGDAELQRLNPFMYRGYYRDTETGWYYLNTRYYDPSVCRFINADDIRMLDEYTLCELNLYVYCRNNPVMYIDPDGYFAGALIQILSSLLSYIGFAVVSLWDADVRADMNAIGWNPFNADESKVLSSKKVSFYKGIPVIRMDGERSGSFLAIWLSRGWTDSNGVFHPENNPDTIRHEWGHNIQQMIMNPITYLTMIGLPSWQEWGTNSWTYYQRPWEITADIFGGVKSRSHANADIERGKWYLVVSTLFGPFGYFFLL